jgi:hypothetical protein
MAAGAVALLQGMVGQHINGGVQPGHLTLGGGPSATAFLLGLGVVKPWDSNVSGRVEGQEPDTRADLGKRSSS